MAREVAEEIGAEGYYETSAKTNTGVNEVFEAAAKIVFEKSGTSQPATGLCDNCVIIWCFFYYETITSTSVNEVIYEQL